MKQQTVRYSNTEVIIVGMILLIGGILRLYTLGDRSLWMDEIAQAEQYISVKSVLSLLNSAAYHFQTPLDYIIGYSLTKIFGFSEFIVRFPAFVFGTLCLLPIYLLTRYIFSRDVAIIAVGLTTVSRWMIAYSQEARPYSIFIFFLFFTLYFLVRAVNENNNIFFNIYGVSAFLMLLTRGYEPLVVMFVLYLVTIILYRTKFLYSLTKVNMIIVIFSVPFFIILMRPLLNRKYVGGENNFHYYLDQLSLLKRHYNTITFFPLSYLISVLLLSGMVIIIRNRSKSPLRIWFLLVAILIASIQFLTYLKMVKLNVAPFAMRYMIYWLPFIYIIISFSILEIGRQAGIFFKRRVYSIVIPLFILLPVFTISGSKTYAYYFEQKEDWKGSSEYIKKYTNANDVVWVETPWKYGMYGGYQPDFYGKPFYSPGVHDYSTDALINYISNNEQVKGNVILVYYLVPKPLYINNDELIMQNFSKITVIRLKYPKSLLKDNVYSLLEEMEKFCPEDSSRVRIYLAMGRLLFAEKKYEDTYIMIRKAAALVQQGHISRFNESIARFFPGLDDASKR